MKITTKLVVALATLSSSAYAAQSYDGYDAFYSAQPGAVFGDPIPFDPDPVERGATVVYSYPGKPGVFTALRARLNR
jgi:hypothetical protein